MMLELFSKILNFNTDARDRFAGRELSFLFLKIHFCAAGEGCGGKRPRGIRVGRIVF